MWELLLAALIVVTVTLICYIYVGRRLAPSVFLGIAAGLVALMVTQPGNTIALPNKYEIGSRGVLFLAIALELALGVYIALMYPTSKQVTVEPTEALQSGSPPQAIV